MKNHFWRQRVLRGWTTRDLQGMRLWRIQLIRIGGGKRDIVCERKPASAVMYGIERFSRETEMAMARYFETDAVWRL